MIWLGLSIDTTTSLIGSMLSSERSGQTDNATRRNAKATMDHADSATRNEGQQDGTFASCD
jgi:hypothetical protein